MYTYVDRQYPKGYFYSTQADPAGLKAQARLLHNSLPTLLKEGVKAGKGWSSILPPHQEAEAGKDLKEIRLENKETQELYSGNALKDH